jgi:type IV pilus assembly protein PilO
LPPWARDPRVLIRIGLGILLAADLITAVLVFKPWAASAQDMKRQAASLRQQIDQKRMALNRLRVIVGKVETARTDGDRFMETNLLSRRTVSSNLLDELEQTARQSGIRQKNANFVFEPIEGSDTLTKATITADYEGNYEDLMRFLNRLDRSPRFLVVEYLEAKPLQNGPALAILLKVDALVREGGGAASAVPVATDSDMPSSQAPPEPVVSPVKPPAPVAAQPPAQRGFVSAGSVPMQPAPGAATQPQGPQPAAAPQQPPPSVQQMLRRPPNRPPRGQPEEGRTDQ